jgi:hypothetical protein
VLNLVSLANNQASSLANEVAIIAKGTRRRVPIKKSELKSDDSVKEVEDTPPKIRK